MNHSKKHLTGSLAARLAFFALKTAVGQARLSVAHLPAGFYACKLEVEGRPLFTRKVSVLH